jgi:succinate dehydrogenase/fumarate reductase cytochrome b subunit (b558 family)
MERESYTTLPTGRQRRALVLRKLHSLSGVVPLGVFLVVHLWTNARALRGDDAFAAGVPSFPALPFIELFGVLLPLAFHAFYGVWLALDSRSNALSYPYAKHWLYVLQRITGFIALAFVLFHLWELRAQKLFHGLSDAAFYDVLAAHLSSTTVGIPLYALAYLTGVAATVFHFTNGMSGFLFSWGLTTTDRGQARARWMFGALGVALFGLGASTVVTFATGSHFGLTAGAAKTSGQCPGAPAN